MHSPRQKRVCTETQEWNTSATVRHSQGLSWPPAPSPPYLSHLGSLQDSGLVRAPSWALASSPDEGGLLGVGQEQAPHQPLLRVQRQDPSSTSPPRASLGPLPQGTGPSQSLGMSALERGPMIPTLQIGVRAQSGKGHGFRVRQPRIWLLLFWAPHFSQRPCPYSGGHWGGWRLCRSET